jgi:uncharacterized damage-inducible protein DinB
MNKQMIDQVWDQFRQKYGVYLRLLEVIPADRYQSHPVPDMRTPAELVVHMSSSMVRGITAGVAAGEITVDESLEAGAAKAMKTPADAIGFARRCWDEANATVAATTDAQLAAMVPTPWNMTLPGWVFYQILGDEFLHHRGQLYAYARVCGVEPPFIWGFNDNAAEFRPAE